MTDKELLHATAVVIQGQAVLLTGASGAGKSDLALRLIDRGACLLADDYIELMVEHDRLMAHAPVTIRGRMEVRGIGIVDVESVDCAPVALLVDLDRTPERLPEPVARRLYGIDIPFVSLHAFESSAPIKVELALKRLRAALETTTS